MQNNSLVKIYLLSITKWTKELKTNPDFKPLVLFNLPIIAVVGVFILIPSMGTFITSFFRDVSFLNIKFLGITNYTRLFTDPNFWQSVFFTLAFVVVSVALELLIGLLFAIFLNKTMPARGLLRLVLLIPWLIPIVISARIWELMYSFDFGILNFLLIKLKIIGSNINWLGSPFKAFISIVISDVWKTTPFMTIILLAGLSTIPLDIYKQAQIDGATFRQQFLKITLPLLKPIIVVALLFRTIDAVRIFDLIYVLTGGGPGGATTSLSVFAFKQYIGGDFGYGSAVSMVIFFIAGLFAVLYIKFGRFKESLNE
ncbi:carbohydrate ABC transporter permease [Candidatus Margulisiibacteriota bacterium]